MKQKKRQNALMAGAGLSLLIVFSQLFGGGGAPRTTQQATMNTGAPEVSVSEETGGMAPASTVRAGFYQNVRRRLQTFIPEQSDAFSISGFEIRGSELGTGNWGIGDGRMEGKHHPQLDTLPPLPVSGLGVREMSGGREDRKTGRQEDIPNSEPRIGSLPNFEHSETQNPQPELEPRLRAFVCDVNTKTVSVIIEWNQSLVRASNEPDSEWQVVSYDNEKVIVKHGDKTWELNREM